VPVVDTNERRLIARVVHGQADGGPATTTADLIQVETLLPALAAQAARASVAFMELGALVCTARTPACSTCPLIRDCAWHRLGRPPAQTARRKSPGYAGTDRHARGVLLGVCREYPAGVARASLEEAWPDVVQARRALSGLVADGLVVQLGEDQFGLPGL
jgi:A/G-specific adenine glycosylase